MNTSRNAMTNALGMDALAGAAMKKDQGNYGAAFPVSRRSSLLSTGDAKLGDSGLVPSAGRHASMPRMPSRVSINEDLPTRGGIGENPLHLYSTADVNSIATANGGHRIQPAAAIPSSAEDHASAVQSRFDSTVTAPSRRRKPNFAEKLHAALGSRECNRAGLTWLPSGRSFCIADQNEFARTILPKFFREAKFESFSRRLKRWGFQKVYAAGGTSSMIFAHHLFHRDRPDLCKIMNGRETRAAPSELQTSDRAVLGGVPAALFSAQDQFRNVVMLRQAQEQQRQELQRRACLQQQMLATAQAARPQSHPPSRVDFLQSLVTPQGPSSSKARAVINNANAPVARPPSQAHANEFQFNPQARSRLHRAKIQLNRLDDDISECEEQLAILQRLKELKEQHRRLNGACNRSRGISPSSING